MAKQTINIGSAPDDGTGDPGRTAFDKCNDNFTELYNADTTQDTAIGLNTTHRGVTTGNPHNVTASDVGAPDATDVLLLNGTQSMDANKSISFASNGLHLGNSVAYGNGFPALESSYAEIQFGSSGDDTMYINYDLGSSIEFGESTNRQNINFYLNGTVSTGINFDFSAGRQMRYSVNNVNSKYYMRFGASGLDGVQLVDNIEVALGTGADATIAYDTNNLVINPKAVGSGYLDVQGDIKAANVGVGVVADRELHIVQVADAGANGIKIENSTQAGNGTFYINASNVLTAKASNGMVFNSTSNDIRFHSDRDIYLDLGLNDDLFVRDSSNATLVTVSEATGNVTSVGEMTATKFNMATTQTYTPSSVTPDRSFNADSTTLDEVADVLGTLIADLQTAGLIS